MDFLAKILEQPVWLQAWVAWMGLVNMASIAFLRRIEAKWTLAAFTGAFVLMQVLFAVNGFNRLLGLAHVVFWTPLVVYLAGRLSMIDRAGAYGVWVRVLLLTNALSLAVDYIDVLRYLLGDRS